MTLRHGVRREEKYDWPATAKETMRQGWADGLSASQIAALFPADSKGIRPSRNAVIGQVHRMGLPHRRAANGADGGQTLRVRARAARVGRNCNPSGLNGAKLRKARDRYKERKPDNERPPVHPIEPLNGIGVTLFDLTGTSCRFPLWGIRQSIGNFCGHSIEEGTRYCGFHARVCLNGIPPIRNPNPEKQDQNPQRDAAFGFL